MSLLEDEHRSASNTHQYENQNRRESEKRDSPKSNSAFTTSSHINSNLSHLPNKPIPLLRRLTIKRNKSPAIPSPQIEDLILPCSTGTGHGVERVVER